MKDLTQLEVLGLVQAVMKYYGCPQHLADLIVGMLLSPDHTIELSVARSSVSAYRSWVNKMFIEFDYGKVVLSPGYGEENGRLTMRPSAASTILEDVVAEFRNPFESTQLSQLVVLPKAREERKATYRRSR